MHFRFAFQSFVLLAVAGSLAACNKPADNNDLQTLPASATPAAARPSELATASAIEESVLENAKPGGQCALDSINGMDFVGDAPAQVKSGQSFTAVGWAVDTALKRPFQFSLVLQGQATYGFKGSSGAARPDVAKALNAETASDAGFNIGANMGNTLAGTYKVLALIKEEGGNTLMCDTHRRVTIGD